MRAVYAHARAARDPGKLATFDANAMKRFVPARAAIVVDCVSYFAGNVLHQRAVQMNVQELRAVADRQYRLAGGESVLEQPVIGMLAPFIGRRALSMSCAAKAPRLHVRGTARQHEPIERLRHALEFRRRERERDLHRIAAGLAHSLQISLVSGAAAPHLLDGSPPGHADPRAMIFPRCHGSVS